MSTTMPYGRVLAVGDCFSTISPVAGLRRPTKLPPCTVNHSMPVGVEDRRVRIAGVGSGILYSVTLPVFGSSLPMSPAELPVYQMLPSLSGVRPCGPEFGVGSVHSLNVPVAGSSRPTTLARWPVYQTMPSGV